ncbi:MAG TPA: glycogen/starch synthase, partial [Acetobacteraceae bacterium]|nr:glycogen/starch synthase [Acetobacteraceae bacterium]
GLRPDIIHAHDWQAGLVAAYLHYQDGARPGVVMTVHNIAYQGQFSAELLAMLGLPPESLSIDGIAHHGQIGYLKAGLQLADRVTTVSPG